MLRRRTNDCDGRWRPFLGLLFCACAVAGAEEPQGGHAFTNRLAHSSSPYLLQHAHNPVDWYPWGKEAFERARREDKPIFLSIGYAACHWCHVMERESFENPRIAKILNEHFICIKVDREERPDVDEVYMAATIAMTGRGGWPMSVFMTPDREPFECGTYYPPEGGRGRRGFRGLCREIAEKWSSDRVTLVRNAGALSKKVRQLKHVVGGSNLIDRATVTRNVQRIARSFDPTWGGRRSGGNKFPPTMAMELMLREYSMQGASADRQLLRLVEKTLMKMADGGIYDQIGGGICRYSTDPRWFAPHFEKMLYDQATVSGIYLSAFQLTHRERYARVARGILDYCLADLQDPAGGFYSSRDADSEGEEGKYYAWRRDEIERRLGPDNAALFCEYYGVKPRGNWHRGRNILHVTVADEAFAARHGLEVKRWRTWRNSMCEILRIARARRVPPGLDDKILAEWNGLLITSLARAYRTLNEPRYRMAAARAADFILEHMVIDGRLFRAHRRGKTHIPGCAGDYANVVEALITLYETTFDRKWLTAAERLNDTFVKRFQDDAQGGFFYTAEDAERLLVRSKNVRDGVIPSGNSTATLNCLRLSILLDRKDLRAVAEKTMRAMQPSVARGRLDRMQWAVLFYHGRPREIAIVGDPEAPTTQALIAEAYRNYLPNKVVALTSPSSASRPDALPLLKGKSLLNGKPAAYVCENYTCQLPVNTPDALRRQLGAAGR